MSNEYRYVEHLGIVYIVDDTENIVYWSVNGEERIHKANDGKFIWNGLRNSEHPSINKKIPKDQNPFNWKPSREETIFKIKEWVMNQAPLDGSSESDLAIVNAKREKLITQVDDLYPSYLEQLERKTISTSSD
ncbi:hypothetical protein [Cerasicoccus maritimus]|uniref:hypothetical protein n=1 Tax=Cerasicoccus maritimus TaxID=490089 RepID=UPI0028527DE8|nr:hypothetical protein [Cerasicoccus maritimus]